MRTLLQPAVKLHEENWHAKPNISDKCIKIVRGAFSIIHTNQLISPLEALVTHDCEQMQEEINLEVKRCGPKANNRDE
jgi:hypothetical protein